jgi:transposase InsO family protein
VVRDTFSRRIIGWSTDTAQDPTLVVNALNIALNIALKKRNPPAGGIVHADHDVRLTSWAFTKKAAGHGVDTVVRNHRGQL